MVRRRHLMNGLAAGLSMPRLAAQTAVPVVCFLALATRQSDAGSVAAFREGMRDLGEVEGRTYTLVEHYAEGDLACAELQLREQLVQGVNVFLTPGAAGGAADSAQHPVGAHRFGRSAPARWADRPVCQPGAARGHGHGCVELR